MEFRHADDVRLHVTDVIRSYPIAASQPAIRQPEEDRARVPGTEDVEPPEGRTLVGYPVIFNAWTEIQSWGGPFLERVAPNAADRTLAARSDKIQLMFNHGFDFALEQTPIGRHLVFTPDDRGVWNEAALVDRGVHEKIDLVADLIRMGAIYGQSFRFEVLGESWRDEPETSEHNPKGLPERTIEEFRWYESGPVTYPAYEATSVTLRDGEPFAVRSREEWSLWAENRSVPTTLTEIVERAHYRLSAKAAIRARSDKLALVAN